MKYEFEKLVDKFYIWLAWKLPTKLVKWAFVRLVTYGTSGKYRNESISSANVTDVLERWIYAENHKEQRQVNVNILRIIWCILTGHMVHAFCPKCDKTRWFAVYYHNRGVTWKCMKCGWSKG